MALARSLADRIDAADMQRSWTKVASGPKKVRTVKPSVRPVVAMPSVNTLIGLSDAQRAAFKRLAGRPRGGAQPGSDALHRLSRPTPWSQRGWPSVSGAGWRCKLHDESLSDTLVWLDLYTSGRAYTYPLGIVKATHPEKG